MNNPPKVSKEELQYFYERVSNLYQNPKYYQKYNSNSLNPFEEKLSESLQSSYILSTNSGWSALVISLLAAGVEENDEVIVPSYTWGQSVSAILHIGAIPIFSDVSLEKRVIETSYIEPLITQKTKAILCVDLFGISCDMQSLTSLAKEHGLPLIQDCAQSFGGTYKGKPHGYYADFTSYSFNLDKSLFVGGLGAVATKSSDNFEKLIEFGSKPFRQKQYFPERPGDFNGLCYSFVAHPILSELACTLLPQSQRRAEERAKNYAIVTDVLANYAFVSTQVPYPDGTSTHYMLPIFIKPNKDYDVQELISIFYNHDIPVFRYIKTPSHLAPELTNPKHHFSSPLPWAKKDILRNLSCCKNSELLSKNEVVLRTTGWFDLPPNEITALAERLDQALSRIRKTFSL